MNKTELAIIELVAKMDGLRSGQAGGKVNTEVNRGWATKKSVTALAVCHGARSRNNRRGWVG